MAIDRGRKNNQLLIQPQYSPMPVGEQIAILYCGTHSLLREDVYKRQICSFSKTLSFSCCNRDAIRGFNVFIKIID